MFKKLVVVSAILATSSTVAFAAGTPYIGAGLGVNHQLFQAVSDDAKVKFGGTGALFNVAGGYGVLVNQNIYLGGEFLVNATTGNVDAVKVDDISSLKFKTKYTYGASFIPGYMLSDNTMAYARVGVVKTRFDVKSSTSSFFDDTTVTESDKNTVTGGQFGLGLQTKVAQNLDVRGEYVYSSYKSFTALDTKINASGGQATVGLVYKFE